jgi:asparagine synthetase B (glutamine-hydrolysing)
MCGLVGFFGNPLLTDKALEVTRWLLWLDVLRGEDSTGVAIRRHTEGQEHPKMVIAKAPGCPTNLYRKYPELFSSGGSFLLRKKESVSMVIGHNRSATIGALNMTNAHPFRHGSITGAHNGTISYGLNRLISGPEIKGQTDSEQIFYSMSKGDTIGDIVNKLHGAMAFSWWDSSTKTMNLFRNRERPLWVVENKTKSVVLWASEKWMLDTAIFKTRNKGFFNEPVSLPEDAHWSYSLDASGNLVKSEKTVSFYVGNKNNTNVMGYNIKPTTFKETTLEKKSDNFLQKGEVRVKGGWLDVEKMTEEEFDEATKYGCAACSENLQWAEKEKVFWLEKDTCLCASCVTQLVE